MTVQHCPVGWDTVGERVRPRIPKPTLLSRFAQAIGPLPPFLLFFWLQRFLPGRRQFYPLPGAGPKECFPRLATAFGTVNRLAPWLKDTKTLCQHAVAGREKGKSWTHGTKDGPSHISVNLLKSSLKPKRNMRMPLSPVP